MENSNVTFSEALQNATGPVTYGLTNDYLFRILFQENKLALQGLLSSLLHIPPESITDIEIKNAVTPGSAIKNKEYRLDLNIVINHRQKIDLEMQVINYDNWLERSLCYLSRIYNDLNRGEKYGDIRPAMLISILDFTLFPDEPRFHSLYKMQEVETHHIYSDKFAIHVLCLNQEERVTEPDKLWGLDKWTELFKATNWEDIKMIANNNKYLTEAANSMFALCDDEEIQRQCHDRDVNIFFNNMEKRHAEMEIAKLKDALVEKDALVAEQSASLAKKDALVAEQSASLAEKDASLAEKDAEIRKLRELLQGKS